jgi:hypothetical protein
MQLRFTSLAVVNCGRTCIRRNAPMPGSPNKNAHF